MKRGSRAMFELESRAYVSRIGLMDNLHQEYSMPVCRYILCCAMALPVKTIIIAERPYSTNIHPFVSSAMSYDPEKSGPTPSTVGVAVDLHRSLGQSYAEVENWVRDSWKHLGSGTVVVNCTVFTRHASPFATEETIAFQRWIRSMVECSASLSSSKIDIICMGVPSQNAVNAMLSSMGSLRSMVSKKIYPNPAMWSRLSSRDTGSQNYTFGKKGTSQSILSAIVRSKEHQPTTIQDYISHMSRPNLKLTEQMGEMYESTADLGSRLEDAYKEIEMTRSAPTVKEALNRFANCVTQIHNAMMHDHVAMKMRNTADDSHRLGKPTEWGSKEQWRKAAPSVGGSSKMSPVPEAVVGVKQKFADMDAGGYGSTGVGQKAAEEQPEPPRAAKKKVTKLVRRPIARPGAPTAGAAVPSSSPVGARITSDEGKCLKALVYCLSELDTASSASLKKQIEESLEKDTVVNDLVRDILQAELVDKRERSKDASASMGLDDGTVDDTCHLPKLVYKLAE